MQLIKFLPLLVLTGLLSCQKPTDAVIPDRSVIDHPDSTVTNPTNLPTQGVVYDKGTPVGQPFQKVIGPEGGTLVSTDGALKMTIPAGAVAKATTFTMQPVTPTLPGLLSGQSFRLLPEGQTFAQPIKLQYHYNADSLDGTSPQLLFMAYQGSDGYWKALPSTELDETTQTLTVSTKHFSDWGAFAEFNLEAKPDVVFPGETANVKLVGYDLLVAPLTENGPQDEVTLAKQKTLENPANIKNWKVVGKGSLKIDASQTTATYTAPTDVQHGSALLTVDVYNFLPANLLARKGSTGKAVIMKTILIEGTYFRAIIDGQSYDCKVFHGFHYVYDDLIKIGGNPTNTSTIAISLHTSALKIGQIDYTSGEPDDIDGKADIGSIDLANPQATDFISYYKPCDGSDGVASPGDVFISEILDVKGKRYVTGACRVTLYHQKGCTLTEKVIKVEFRVPMITID